MDCPLRHSYMSNATFARRSTTEKGAGVASRIRDYQITIGGVASPFDCWLILRGLRTMAVRLEGMCASAMKLAGVLENHNFVEWVRYPGLASHPQHAVAEAMLDLYGQMVTIKVKGDSDGAMAFVGAVLLAKRATSTGGTETLVQHQRSVEMEKVTDGGIVRISVGLEDVDDLIEDFERALWVAERVLNKGPDGDQESDYADAGNEGGGEQGDESSDDTAPFLEE